MEFWIHTLGPHHLILNCVYVDDAPRDAAEYTRVDTRCSRESEMYISCTRLSDGTGDACVLLRACVCARARARLTLGTLAARADH